MRSSNTHRVVLRENVESLRSARKNIRRLSLECLEARQLLSVSPTLLADIGGPDSSLSTTTNARQFVGHNGIAYFSADDGIHGFELWRSDGTEAGTYLLKDINPGGSSGVTEITAVGDSVYFTATDGVHGTELWKSDGTTEGTVLVQDLRPGSQSSSPVRLTDVSGTLFFVVNDGTTGSELWRTDGTPNGLTLVKDIHPTGNANPIGLTNVGGELFFAANDATGRGLWKSDGTEAGTVLLSNHQALANINTSSLISVNETLFFTTGEGNLWKSDGTSEGTVPLPASARALANFDGTLYYATYTDLYRLEGDTTPQLINFFGVNSFVIQLSTVGDKLFIATGLQSRYQLWVSDGTSQGTSFVLDIGPGTGDLSARPMIDLAGTLYFSPRSGNGKSELWKSDGTAEGTMQVKDIWPGADGADVAHLTNVAGKIFFRATDPEAGTEPWVSDGTEAGTFRVRDINQQTRLSSTAAEFTGAGATTYFSSVSLAHGRELWKTDGTTAGTVFVKDVNPGRLDSKPRQFTEAGGLMYFIADTTDAGTQLWRSDGTSAGTFALTTGASIGTDVMLLSLGGKLFFSSRADGVNDRLWESDGTVPGTQPVAGALPLAPPGSTANLWRNHIVAVGSDLYYVGIRPAPFHYIYELWKYSPGSSTHLKVTELNVVPTSQLIFPVASSGELVFFEKLSFQGQRSLWRTDGTPAGTVWVSDSVPNYTTEPVALGGRLFYGASDPETGTELWSSDGTAAGTSRVKDIAIGPASSPPKMLTVVNETVFFVGNDATGAIHLWKSDGTESGTVPVDPEIHFIPLELTNVDGLLFFKLLTYPRELWQSDGTPEGTFRIMGAEEQITFNTTLTMGNGNGLLYFLASDPDHGSEPWILAPPVAARLFYNNSKFDQVAGASGDADDAALAVDKLPYIPGNGPATGDNVSSYSKGINGLFIDLASGHGEITAEDFVFRMGTSTDPTGWIDAPAPISITVRAGAGIAGHDRVEIVFADEAIKNTWLEVTVRGNDARGGFHTNTALDESSVFYFGSRVGDTFTGNSAAAAVTSSADALQIRAAGGTFAASGNRHDINRDGIVSAGDELLARFNPGILLMLELPALSDPPASPAALAVTPAADPLSSAVASALGGALNKHVDSIASASSHASGWIDRVPATSPLRAIASAREAAAQFADEALLELTEGESLDETAAEENDRLLDAVLSLS